ncbi:hypothetical protein Tco_1429522, partial [Tanacetum coccineum]
PPLARKKPLPPLTPVSRPTAAAEQLSRQKMLKLPLLVLPEYIHYCQVVAGIFTDVTEKIVGVAEIFADVTGIHTVTAAKNRLNITKTIHKYSINEHIQSDCYEFDTPPFTYTVKHDDKVDETYGQGSVLLSSCNFDKIIHGKLSNNFDDTQKCDVFLGLKPKRGVLTSMASKVAKVLVEEGTELEKGQPLSSIYAMKGLSVYLDDPQYDPMEGLGTEDDFLKRYQNFKKFDTVVDHSDHQFSVRVPPIYMICFGLQMIWLSRYMKNDVLLWNAYLIGKYMGAFHIECAPIFSLHTISDLEYKAVFNAFTVISRRATGESLSVL